MGESARDKSANQLNDQLRGESFTARNRFDNYQDAFTPEQMQLALGTLFGQQTDLLNTNMDNQIAQGQQSTAARLASQGITGGSIFNNQIGQVRNAVNNQRASALAQLGIGKMNQSLGLMNTANDNKFRIASAGQNVDMTNVQNRMNQYNMRMQNLQNLDNTNTYDDILAGLNTGANILKALTPGGK